MITKCIIILGGGFGEAKCAETLRDELPLDQADVVHFSLENHRVELERRWTR